MKIAISIPDDVFHEIDACARRLRVPRSRLVAEGARLVLARYAARNPTAVWNEVLDQSGQPGEEPAVRALRSRSKQAVRRMTRDW